MKNVSNASVTLHVCTLQRLSELWQVWQVQLRSIHSAVSLGVPWALCPTLAWHTQGLDSTSVHQMRHQHMIYTLYYIFYTYNIYIYTYIFYTYIYIWCRYILIWCRRYWEKNIWPWKWKKVNLDTSWHSTSAIQGPSVAFLGSVQWPSSNDQLPSRDDAGIRAASEAQQPQILKELMLNSAVFFFLIQQSKKQHKKVTFQFSNIENVADQPINARILFGWSRHLSPKPISIPAYRQGTRLSKRR